MHWLKTVAVGVCALLALTTTRAVAGTGCEAPPDSILALSSLSEDALVEMAIVFVGFPEDSTRHDLPSWGDSLVDGLASFIESMSHGAQTLNPTILKRPGADSTKAWIADSTASWYVTTNFWGVLNFQILTDIHEEHFNATGDSLFKDIEEVILYHYKQAWADSGLGGVAKLSLPLDSFPELLPGFSGGGSTIRLPSAGSPSNNANRRWAEYSGAHEYGHRLGFPHTPNTILSGSVYVNMGRYDLMRANGGGGISDQGFLPYHPRNLIDASWLDEVVISSDTTGLSIANIRDADDGAAYRVNAPDDTTRYFLLANYQEADFDSTYRHSGLLIWHIMKNIAWDLECAEGKFVTYPGGDPDPNDGIDFLESSASNKGQDEDFFDGTTGYDEFSANTNPNTNLNDSTYTSPQSVVTGYAFENIEKSGSDIIVDVYVTPKQLVTYPNGGEAILFGDSITVQWDVRAGASVDSVDILLSSNSGGQWETIASGIANTGSYTIAGPDSTKNTYRARVVSYNETTTGTDDSDADFSVWAIDASSIDNTVTTFCKAGSDVVKFDVSWTTTASTDGDDVLKVYFPSRGDCDGTPSSTETEDPNGTSHQVVLQAPCQADWFWYTVTSQIGTSVAVSECDSVYVSSCPSCPPCPPPCELE